ncbi:MAG: hypothetical protein ACXIUM_01515 [Wenzhouxiangella sp.]
MTLDADSAFDGLEVYSSPEFAVHKLKLITLGGSPGVADSGDSGEASPFGFPKGGSGTGDEADLYTDDPFADDDRDNWNRGGGF